MRKYAMVYRIVATDPTSNSALIAMDQKTLGNKYYVYRIFYTYTCLFFKSASEILKCEFVLYINKPCESEACKPFAVVCFFNDFNDCLSNELLRCQKMPKWRVH